MKKSRRSIIAILIAVMLICMSLAIFSACSDKAVQGIEITTPPTKTDYVAGETFDPDGMVVSVVYEDDSTETLESTDYTIDPSGELTISNRTITITYTAEDGSSYEATQAITVHNEIVSLEVTQEATKTGYVIGEVFDPAGMIITLTYEDGSTREVSLTSDNVTYDTDPLTGDEDEITLTYSGIEFTQEIEFAVSVTLKTGPTKTEYIAGERFDPAGMVLEVTYESGNKAEVTVSGSSATYPEDPLTTDDTTIVVSYGGFEIEVEITFEAGVFIEAEDGIIDTSSTQWARTDAGEDVDEQYQASGGVYVGDLSSGDSVTFVFYSDRDGTGSISFRMASQYVKEANGWTPILMGDCQFNKICTFTVNGVEYDIPDSAILPGGGESGGEPDNNLWLNWQEVTFDDITFKEGRNDIKLTFIPHDYTDVASSVAATYAGKFTANIDCLIITSADCEVSPCTLSVNSITPTEAKLETEGEVTSLVVSGTIDYEGYYAEEVVEFISIALTLDGTAVSADATITVEDSQFEIRIVTDNLASGDYSIYVNLSTSTQTALQIAGATASEASCKHGEYKTVVGDDGTITLNVNSNVEFTYTAVSTDLIEEDGKAVYVVYGTYTVEGYDNDEVIELVKKIMLDLQYNGLMDWSWNFSYNAFYAYDVTLGTDGDTLTFTAKYDISELGNGYYYSHYGNVSTNIDASEAIEKTITVDGRTYTMTGDPAGGDGFYGCVGIIIQDAQ